MKRFVPTVLAVAGILLTRPFSPSHPKRQSPRRSPCRSNAPKEIARCCTGRRR
ncbi:MAG: hypothetical protein P4N24_17140 [Acidobacteriota bacterium]|nr:hypothetical protein [Acidobacteriota bacterium]